MPTAGLHDLPWVGNQWGVAGVLVIMNASKRLLALLALGVAAVMTTACDDSTSSGGSPAGPPAELVIEYSDWNGWDLDDVPEDRFASLTGLEGEEVTLEVMGGVTIEVVEVDGDEITIETSEPMAPRSGSGIDLRNTVDSFVIRPASPAEFATPTEDAGWTFEVRFDDGEEPAPSQPTCNPEHAGCGAPIE